MVYRASQGRGVSRWMKKYNKSTIHIHRNTRDRLREFADGYNISYDVAIDCLLDYFERKEK